MHFGVRQAAYRVKDGIIKQKKLVAICIVWVLFCIFRAVADQVRVYNFYQIDISAADILLLLQNYWQFGIQILPVVAFVVMRCKLDSLNIQFMLRHVNRSRVLHRQAAESVIYAAGISMFLVITETFYSVTHKMPFVNWDSMNSLYFQQTKMLISEHFILVCIAVFLMYFVKFLMVMAILDILIWFPKGIYMFWTWIILMAGMEFVTANFNGFFTLFSVRYKLWQHSWRQSIWVAAGILTAVAVYLIGGVLIRKRDVFKS